MKRTIIIAKSNPALETAILNNHHKDVRDIVCRERLIINSIVYNDGKSVMLVEGLANAKIIARQLCKETKRRVLISHHNPFDYWREYVTVYYTSKKLRWNYLHVDALDVKNV